MKSCGVVFNNPLLLDKSKSGRLGNNQYKYILVLERKVLIEYKYFLYVSKEAQSARCSCAGGVSKIVFIGIYNNSNSKKIEIKKCLMCKSDKRVF